MQSQERRAIGLDHSNFRTPISVMASALEIDDRSELGKLTSRVTFHLLELLQESGFVRRYNVMQIEGSEGAIVVETPLDRNYQVQLSHEDDMGAETLQLWVNPAGRSIHGLATEGHDFYITSWNGAVRDKNFGSIPEMTKEEQEIFLKDLLEASVSQSDTEDYFNELAENPSQTVVWVRDLR